MSYEEIYLGAEEKMDKSLHVLEGEMKKVRSGRANPALVEDLQIPYYGAMTPLKQLAQVTAADAQLLVIKPFDSSAVQAIEKAIQASNLGITPATDGKVIRLPLPPLSEERRKQMIHLVKDAVEQCKVAIRNVRHEALRHLDAEQKGGELTEDDAKRLKDDIQAQLKSHEGRAEDLFKKKTEELMKV